MKVIYEKSMQYKIRRCIQSISGNVVLRSDVEALSSPRQVSRALKKLVEAGELIKLGYGVYGKLVKSRFSDKPYLQGGFLLAVREALDKLNIPWELSSEEQAYNAGRTTQVPANPSTVIKGRFRRQLHYRNRRSRFE